jgi:serine/threonine protein kinase
MKNVTTPADTEAPTLPASSAIFSKPTPPTAASYRHYVIERRPDGSLWELGRGGMGVTYRAVDTNLHCPVALKIIGPQCFGSESSRRRFVREARLAAQIRHPNVAAIYHLDQQDGEFFYSMEFVDGVTAAAWVEKHGPLPISLALDIAMQVARALTAADAFRLIHRDIKPGNIMLCPDPADSARVIVKVIDFGLARSLEMDSGPEMLTCAFAGTPLYASPEQVENLELDIRSDIYSLGCTLWFLLTGRAPFVGSIARVISQQLTAEPPWNLLPPIPAALHSLLRSMLAKEPVARPQSPIQVHAAICACRERLQQSSALAVHPLRKVDAPRRWDFTSRKTIGWAAAALATGVVFARLLPTSAESVDPPAVAAAVSTPTIVAAVPPTNMAPAIPPAPEAPAPAADQAASPIPGVEAPTAPPESEPFPGTPEIAAVPPPDTNRPDLDGASEGSNPLGLFDDAAAAEPKDAIDLRGDQAVELSLQGLAASDQPSSAFDKPVKKSTSSSGRRTQSSGKHHSAPFKPVDRVRRSVQHLLHRIF